MPRCFFCLPPAPGSGHWPPALTRNFPCNPQGPTKAPWPPPAPRDRHQQCSHARAIKPPLQQAGCPQVGCCATTSPASSTHTVHQPQPGLSTCVCRVLPCVRILVYVLPSDPPTCILYISCTPRKAYLRRAFYLTPAGHAACNQHVLTAGVPATVARMAPATPCWRPLTNAVAGRQAIRLPSAAPLESSASTATAVVTPLAHLVQQTQSYQTFANLLSKENYMKQVRPWQPVCAHNGWVCLPIV